MQRCFSFAKSVAAFVLFAHNHFEHSRSIPRAGTFLKAFALIEICGRNCTDKFHANRPRCGNAASYIIFCCINQRTPDPCALISRPHRKIFDVERHTAIPQQPHHTDGRSIFPCGKRHKCILQRCLDLLLAGRLPADRSIQIKEYCCCKRVLCDFYAADSPL